MTSSLIKSRRTVTTATVTIFLTLSSTANTAVYVDSPDRLWPGGVVPVEWDPAMPLGNRLAVIAAMNIWSDVANVTFAARTDEEDYVIIQNAQGTSGSSSPFIGRNGNSQPLNIRQDLSNITVHGLAHEVGHVLGYFHSHQRTDWNQDVTIYNSRMIDCRAGNFNVANNSLAYPRNKMDYDSVMSYGECIFSNCGWIFDSSCACGDSTCPRWTNQDCDLVNVTCCSENRSNCRVIEIIDTTERSNWQSELGQRDHLSKFDAMTMSFLYPEPRWRFLERFYSPTDLTGTFHNPFVTLSSGLEDTPSGGVLWIQPATYNNPASVITKPVLLRAPVGGVVIR